MPPSPEVCDRLRSLVASLDQMEQEEIDLFLVETLNLSIRQREAQTAIESPRIPPRF